MAHQILGFICNESLCCNIILLDRPRPSFKLDNEDAVKNLDSKSKKDEQNEKNQQDKKKKKKKKKKRIDDEDNEDDNKNEDKDDDEDEDENEDEDEEEDEDESEDEDDQLKGDNNGIKSKIVKYRKKKNKQGSKSHSDSDTDSDSNSNLNSGSDSDSDSGSDSDSSDNNQKDNEFGNDDDDYYEENDYLAFKRETYMGVFESKLMDGMVKISYNTKKDEKKERKKKRKMLKKGEGNKNENSENSIEYKLSYHKSIEFEFDRFFFTIEHKYNKSIVKMIIFETENRSYEIRFRVDPEVGRDNFYYAMIAFQGCYRSQNYDWDSHLKNGNIAPIKDLIQEELELLALKGYN